MKISEEIAEIAEKDGGVYISSKALRACKRRAISKSIADDGSIEKYYFIDGSSVVVTDSGWDLGFEGLENDGHGCMCFASAGHHKTKCPYAP